MEEEELFSGIYAGSITLSKLPAELSSFTFEEIMAFVIEGFGELDSDLKVARMASYNGNITAFSGAKTFQEVKDLNNFVFMEDGTKRPFKEFRGFAENINDKYNKVWLKTEQDTSFAVSQNADKWLDFEADKEDFPMLKYQTAADERVRPEHADWDNLTFPVNDSFWDTRMPSNGFNCRCTVINLAGGRKSSLKGVPANSDKMFNVNPGKVDYIFNENKHPYFKHTKAEGPDFERALRWRSKE
jgi:SPP1 gp7 family putative phage head morphogenesis protein